MDVLTEKARIGFAHGWALSSGPLTDTVKAACLVAIAHVRETGDLDDAVDLGHLSGTWALLHSRREQVYADQLAAIITAWRRLLRKADLPAAVDRYRRHVGLTELADPDKRRRTAEAAAAAVMALHILVDPNDPDWAAFVDALNAGMTIAQAEGVAGAVGVAAAQAGVTGVDFQHAYDDALAHPVRGSASDTRAAANSAATTILRGATTDLTNALVAADRDGLSAADMLTAAEDRLGLDDSEGDGAIGNDAASLLGDQTLGQSFFDGALAWFVAQGARQINFIAQADACIVCENLAAASPYFVFDIPDPPIHPRCRCVTEPADPVFGFDFTQYLN